MIAKIRNRRIARWSKRCGRGATASTWSSAARAVVIKMPERSVTANGLAALGDLISRHQGSAAVLLQVETDDGMTIRLRPQQFFRLNVAPELTAEIEEMGDNWRVELVVGE